MNGNLSMSPLSIAAGSALSGVGVVGTTMNAGTIVPGASGLGVLSVSGDVTFAPGSAMSVLIAPGGSSGRLAVSGTAFLLGNGTLTVTPTSGFYGLTQTYTLLNAGFVSGMFASHVITNPNFVGTFSYNPTSVTLFVQVLRPFQDFSYSNSNTRAVGTNIDELNASGSILPDMAAVLDTLAGQSDSVINEALDQMHPAAFSAFAELQAEVGGQLLSLFHRRPFLICGCSESNRLWVEPFGNWLKEKEQGEQIGFDATTRGIAFGYDREFFDCWSFGVGGAWNATDLTWKLDRGHAYTDGLYGAFYTDFYLDNFYLGGSVYAGLDWFTTARHIRFTTIDRQAEGHFNGLDIGGQFTAAYYFGSPACLFYPYGTVDYLYLNESSFSESGADSLDLNVGSYTSQTLRSEAGFAMQIIDKNYRETICLSPLISFGWAMEWPLDRSPYQSSFSEQTLPFIVHGWDQTWQLLNIRFGFGIVYRCFTLDSLYIADISPDGGSPFFNQRANFRLSYTF
jgi:outer membrane autotransporter protein